MKTITKVINLYSYDELSAEANEWLFTEDGAIYHE